MNFVGHIHIASVCLDQHAYPPLVATDQVPADAAPTSRPPGTTAPLRYYLGTALPDFAAIGRFQLRNESSSPEVRIGIDMHHATDAAFHGSDWFLAQSKALGADLRANGINRGAARACGHVGVELLLDGNLLLQRRELATEAQQVLESTNDQQLNLEGLVEDPHTDSWTSHLRRIGSWTLPTDYHEPEAVAERLQRILSHRPRLAFETSQIGVVADALARITQPVVDGIDDMVRSVAEESIVESSRT